MLPTPYYDRDGIVVYHGDCRAILPLLAGAGVTILASDPAYRIESGGNSSGRMMGGIFDPSVYDNSGDLFPTVPYEEWVGPAVATLAPDADLYVMANDKGLGECLNAIKASRCDLHNVLVWSKGVPTPNRWYMKSVEFVAFAWRGRAMVIRDPSSQQLIDPNRVPPIRGVKYHPTEKPVGLFQPWLANSARFERAHAASDLVLDPFMGVGPALRAARMLGMRAIGIDLNEAYLATAVALLEWDAGRGPKPVPTVKADPRETPLVSNGQYLMDLAS